MNIADSMKHILKNKTHVFSDFWKNDLLKILSDLSMDMKDLFKDGRESVSNLKKFTLQDMIDAGSDSILIIKVLPGRIQKGFLIFKDEITEDLELLPDQKQKTIFTLKIIGALTSYTLSTIYNVKRSSTDFSLKGFKKSNAFTQFLIAEVIFRVSHALINRFLQELESHVSDEEELAHIHYFQDLLRTRSKKEDHDQGEEIPHDRAIEIVENLKKYIMTGKRGIE